MRLIFTYIVFFKNSETISVIFLAFNSLVTVQKNVLWRIYEYNIKFCEELFSYINYILQNHVHQISNLLWKVQSARIQFIFRDKITRNEKASFCLFSYSYIFLPILVLWEINWMKLYISKKKKSVIKIFIKWSLIYSASRNKMKLPWPLTKTSIYKYYIEGTFVCRGNLWN